MMRACGRTRLASVGGLRYSYRKHTRVGAPHGRDGFARRFVAPMGRSYNEDDGTAAEPIAPMGRSYEGQRLRIAAMPWAPCWRAWAMSSGDRPPMA
jgi:hypothetical protein